MTKSLANNKVTKIESINLSKYAPGCLAYGYVVQIVDNSKLIVSLPGGFSGVVLHQEVSDTVYKVYHEAIQSGVKEAQVNIHSLPTHSLFSFSLIFVVVEQLPDLASLVKLMQPVRCCVLGSTTKPGGKKQSLMLSMRSSLVNKGLALKHFATGFPISGCVASIEDHG